MNQSSTSVVKEHSYSVISRCEKKQPVKVALMGYQARAYQYKIKALQSNLCRLRKKTQSLKQRLVNAEKISNDVYFQHVIANMKKPAQIFIQMQKQAKKDAKGRRFSTEEKILCLSLFKKSAKCYRLLSKYFTLPSSRTMKRVLSKIKISEGINKIIFEKIKHSMNDQEVPDRLCTLIFDEMSITPQVFYDSSADKFSGFASNQDTAFADHALVFMVKGVKKHYKQPVAYYFTSGLKKNELKELIKSVIKEVLKTGLIVVATICDQSAVNVGAITELIEETKATYIRQGKEWQKDVLYLYGKKIIPLYDTPHLIKGIRNNLLNKDLYYTVNNQTKTIKWEYFVQIYHADKAQGELRLLNKLTEEHINKAKINKMRVKSATQLFSHSVAVVTSHLAARGEVPTECQQLIDFTLLIDNIFDSLNGSSYTVSNGKIYKGPLKRNSPHHQLWKNAITILKTVKFVNKVRLTESIAPSVKNLIKTIEGMQTIWQILNKKYDMDAVLTRNFNQDPLENFFGSIRSYGARNIAPNTVCFEGAYKALMVNNMSSPHSKRANCEEDSNECLQNLNFYLKEKIDCTPVASENINYNLNLEAYAQLNENDAGQSNYVCGWVITKCLKKIIKKCENCRKNILEKNNNINNNFIRRKEYCNKRWLCYPNAEMEKYFKSIQNIAVSVLKKNVSKNNIKRSILLYEDLLIECPFRCHIHKVELKSYFVDITLNVILHSWTRSVNRILSGKITYDGDDEMKKSAQLYFNKRIHYKNRK
ncbi:unnamed protein product [Diatraea saccharalis]|uniref:Transposase n=1 Tax=Diatraea saccharalis TaxID=40085 RepID=A0A9N9W5V6_9NEOP|nr:unnamed protein product [Diatraea saccharalis]